MAATIAVVPNMALAESMVLSINKNAFAIEYGTTLCTVRHVYGNRDRCILYEEVNVVLLLIPMEDLFYYSVFLYAYIIKLTIE